jgi:hypothetical protein
MPALQNEIVDGGCVHGWHTLPFIFTAFLSPPKVPCPAPNPKCCRARGNNVNSMAIGTDAALLPAPETARKKDRFPPDRNPL